MGTLVQKKGRTFTLGLTRGLGGSDKAGPKPNGGGGGAPPPGGGGGGIPIPGEGGGGITESGEDKAGGNPTTVTGGVIGFTIGGSAVWDVGGDETEFRVGAVCDVRVGDCEVLVSTFSEATSRSETRKFKSYHTNYLTLQLLYSLVKHYFNYDAKYYLVLTYDSQPCD